MRLSERVWTAQRRRLPARARSPRGGSLRRDASMVPLAAAASVAPPIASRLPSRSNRITRHPPAAAILASSASGFTATGLPTARSIGRSEAESE